MSDDMMARGPENDNPPGALAWDRRRKAAHPLPGGYDAYLTSLGTMLDWITEHRPKREALEQWLVEHFSISPIRARLMIDFLQKVSLLHLGGAAVALTRYADRWQANHDPAYLLALLHSRIQFIGEMIAALREPHDTDEVLAIANRDYAMGWQTRAQVDRRRGWLQSAGAIQADAERRLVATELGLHLIQRLDLHAPQPPAPDTALRDRRETSRGEEAIRRRPAASDDLEEALRRAARLIATPADFERAVADAFRLLGYEATHLGGPGQTDVLLVAALGREDTYRVIVDCKTTSHEGVGDTQIDWMTLREHRTKHDATYVAVVGPAFSGERVRARARDQRVTLIDVPGLITLLRQHLSVPMGLHTYRELFTGVDADEGAAAVAEAADDFSRGLMLAAETLRLVRALEPAEGGLTARDVYWNLRSHEQLASATDGELLLLLEALASPPLQLLRRSPDDKSYRSIGQPVTAGARLRALAALIEGSSPGSD